MTNQKLGATTLSLLAAVIGTTAVAQSTGGFYEGGYIEGNIGYSSGPDIDTETFSGSVGGLTFSNAGLSLDYDDDVSFGVELGMRFKGPMRVGLGITRFNFDFDKVSGRGTVSDGTDTLNLNTASLSASDVGSSVANELDTNATLFSLNSYYDFNKVGGFEPFVGFGLGLTDIEDTSGTEFTGSLYAGVKYAFDGGMYVGGRISYHNINGPEDDLGIEYDDFSVTSLSVLLGYDF